MKLTFEPTICKPDEKGNPPLYSGTVTLRMPTYDERMELYDAYGLEESGETDAPAAPPPDPQNSELIRAPKPASTGKSARSGIHFMRYAARQIPAHLESVEIKRLSDGFVLSTWDQINHDSDMVALITEVSSKLVGKFSVGNGSAPS